MSNDNTNLDFVRRRLNSFMNTMMEGEQGAGETNMINIEHQTLRQFREFHKKVVEMFPENKLLPIPASDEKIQNEHRYSHGFYVKTTTREIADALGITLNIDKGKETSPLMAQYQNQTSTQINLQTVSNVIECINSLNLDWGKKEQLVKLTKDFEDAAKANDAGKLKSILMNVAEISPKVAGFLLEHSAEIGTLKTLLGF